MDQQSLDDLARSGLVAEDIGARSASHTHFAAIKVSMTAKGYVIPYYDIKGAPMPFYRVKLFGEELKYKQVAGTSNHVYFPKMLHSLMEERRLAGTLRYLLITEGEKKAACAVKKGIPCVALGGVDSYKNRTIILPVEGEIQADYKEKGQIKVKIPAGSIIQEEPTAAMGIQEIVNYCVEHKVQIIIVYDSDSPSGTNFEVQRAAAGLGYQFVHMGLSARHIRQLILPFELEGKKVGLDDYLMAMGEDKVNALIEEVLSNANSFPKHPNIRALINSRLQQGKLTRREVQEVSLSVLADLDTRGKRLRSTEDRTPYYFDGNTFKLMQASLLGRNQEPLHESVFGSHLYRNYGISSADSKVISWLAAQYTGEEPIEDATPRKVITLTEDGVAYQISDSHFIVVSSDPNKPYRILTNGSEGILFEQDNVEGIEINALKHELDVALKEQPQCFWHSIFNKAVSFNGDEQGMKLAALLYYLSPWIRRWNGTQLPVELIIGEAGSGKSSLYELRLMILTGRPVLRNMPQDLKDWYASITGVGGLHVIDNVKFTNREIQQRISDEICRIITEPDPHVEMRKLYTTAESFRMQVNTIFAMTAIQIPFHNADLIQRASIIKLGAVKDGHDSKWVQTQLEAYGGRVKWMAHHLSVLHKFLVLTKTEWNKDYRSAHRLANYEQSMQLMAKVFGWESDWISNQLIQRMQSTMTENDWILEALQEYCAYIHRTHPQGALVKANDICIWAMSHEAHHENQTLTNSRSLGHYMKKHSSIVEKILNIKEGGKYGGTQQYNIGPIKLRKDK